MCIANYLNIFISLILPFELLRVQFSILFMKANYIFPVLKIDLLQNVLHKCKISKFIKKLVSLLHNIFLEISIFERKLFFFFSEWNKVDFQWLLHWSKVLIKFSGSKYIPLILTKIKSFDKCDLVISLGIFGIPSDSPRFQFLFMQFFDNYVTVLYQMAS